ncbi:splicing factor SF2, partial [Toxoplasma gondii RUB]
KSFFEGLPVRFLNCLCRAADDAIEGRDGAHLGFHRIRIERSRQRLRRPGEFRRDRGGYGGRESGGNGPAYGPPRRSEFRVRVYGLPPTASWQDLKDHMRRAGDVGYANIEGGVGVVEYSNGDDMDYALRKLHGSVFRNIFHTAKIRVERDMTTSRHRSRSPRGGRRGSRSPVEYSSPERRREEAERERRRCARDEEEARHTRRSRSASSRHGRRREEAYSDHEERREKSLDGDRFEETERGKPREREDGRRPRSVSRSSQESRGERDGLAKDEREKGETRRDDERERRRSRSPSDYRGRGQKRDREDEREDDRRRVRGDDFSEETRRNGLERDERGERDERDERDDREGVRRSFERDREETRRGRRDEEREEARHSGDEE